MIERGLPHKIYCASFLLAILVVGIHCSFLDSPNPELVGFGLSFTLQRFFIAIGDVTVPMFFVISGYLHFCKFSLESYPRMLLRKVSTLVIPYLLDRPSPRPSPRRFSTSFWQSVAPRYGLFDP